MNANFLVKAAVPVALVLVLALVVTRCSRQETATPGAPPVVGGEALAPETAAALGIEADTPDDVVRTLIANTRETNDRLATLETANEALRAENARLREMRSSIVAEISGDLNEVARTLRRESETATENAREEYTGLVDRLESLYRSVPAAGSPGRSLLGDRPAAGEVVWLPPLEHESVDGGLLPWGQGPAGAVPFEKPDEEVVQPVRPVYTVPKNSTLIGARAFTALIGRVPIGEAARVTDPYFFKLLIGRDNLVANGHEIPEIAYAVASGQAIGDWNLRCVSGDVESFTFVFEDGRVVTVPEPGDVTTGASNTRSVRLGGLSDDYGNPCVSGRRISNAGAYLGQSVAVLTAGAAAEGLAAAQTTSVASGVTGGATTVVDGDIGRYAAGRGLSGAAQEVARWLRARQAQEYDVVYVPPGARVAVHVDEELRIDYDPAGRLVHHERTGTGGYRALD